MSDKAIYFEVFSILLMLGLGTGLLIIGLAGWGLVGSGLLLASLSAGSRGTAWLSNKTTSPA